jgi:histidine ammonia-lyase
LWDAFFAAFAAAGGPPSWGDPQFHGVALRYAGAAEMAELKQLAAPATLDVPPLDMEVEDHATSAPLAVRKTAEALDLLESLLAIEFLLARDVLALREPPRKLGARTAAALKAVQAAIGQDPAGPAAGAVHRRVRGVISGGLA